ncbi:Unknown protein, partial [Striga hermonthica]
PSPRRTRRLAHGLHTRALSRALPLCRVPPARVHQRPALLRLLGLGRPRLPRTRALSRAYRRCCPHPARPCHLRTRCARPAWSARPATPRTRCPSAATPIARHPPDNLPLRATSPILQAPCVSTPMRVRAPLSTALFASLLMCLSASHTSSYPSFRPCMRCFGPFSSLTGSSRLLGSSCRRGSEPTSVSFPSSSRLSLSSRIYPRPSKHRALLLRPYAYLHHTVRMYYRYPLGMVAGPFWVLVALVCPLECTHGVRHFYAGRCSVIRQVMIITISVSVHDYSVLVSVSVSVQYQFSYICQDHDIVIIFTVYFSMSFCGS